MTHEELLEKIKELDKSFSSPGNVFSFNDKQNKALRAVVETTQHPPVSDQWQWVDGWKCAMLTIAQAIEKELG